MAKGFYTHVHANDGKTWAHPDSTKCPEWTVDAKPTDPVNLPPHYRALPVECIDVTQHFNFCLGNAIKYIWRADHKGNPIQDLRKSIWYIQREIERREREAR